MGKILLCFLVAALAVSSARAVPLKVIALTGVIGDLAHQVGGERIEVFVLPQKSLHEREMSPRDAIRISRAALVLASGMGLDDALASQITRVATTRIVQVSADIIPIATNSCSSCDHTTHASTDPHWWHSIANAKIAVANIRNALATADPDGAATYNANATSYIKRLDALQKWATIEIAKIPREKRIIALPHDALAYFARDFGFETISVMGFDSQPSTRQMAKTLALLKKTKFLFPERSENRQAAETLARTNKLHLSPALDVDDLHPDSPTYEAMMRRNIQIIADALK